MRKIPTPPGGSEQWRNGWETGYEQALIDAERDHPKGHVGPRTWQIEYPPAPPAGTRVQHPHAPPVTVGKNGRVVLDGVRYSWREFVEAWGPLTEVVETEVEAAARRLREAGYTEPTLWRLGGQRGDDIRTVLRHVLNGGQL
jgi:hypothetical protein